uniref:Uncharacterized protein n=1 Tax=Cacopsylla melanoneura TaxID=428564 RepID=A0A8D8VJ47_9HEMI
MGKPNFPDVSHIGRRSPSHGFFMGSSQGMILSREHTDLSLNLISLNMRMGCLSLCCLRRNSRWGSRHTAQACAPSGTDPPQLGDRFYELFENVEHYFPNKLP